VRAAWWPEEADTRSTESGIAKTVRRKAPAAKPALHARVARIPSSAVARQLSNELVLNLTSRTAKPLVNENADLVAEDYRYVNDRKWVDYSTTSVACASNALGTVTPTRRSGLEMPV
jgi:hypothetical protein